MHVSQSIAFSKILSTLEAMKAHGVHFKIVADGQEYGDLQVVQASQKKRNIVKSRKYGAVRNTYKPTLSAMKVGDVVTLKTPKLPDLTTTQYSSNICAWCTSNWGKGSYMVSQTQDDNGVEVMRVA